MLGLIIECFRVMIFISSEMLFWGCNYGTGQFTYLQGLGTGQLLSCVL